MFRLSLLPVLVAALAGCTRSEPTEVGLLPVDQAGPTGVLTLSITPLVPGFPATFRTTGAIPGKSVIFFRSTQVQPSGFCPPPIAPACLDLKSPVTQQFTATANGAGVAQLTITLPAVLPITTAGWQSGYFNSPTIDSSNAVTTPIFPPTSDTDGDGLTAAQEVGTHHTHPGIADTDGGGVSDGAEVAAGTDPTDPADDNPGTALDIDDLVAGDLVVTEIMKDPAAVSDGDGEWFEILNLAGADVDLNGLIFEDAGSDLSHVTSSTIVPAGGYAVIGVESDPAINGGVTTVVWEWRGTGFSLANFDDEVILTNSAGEIGRVNYDDGITFPDPSGASMNLDTAHLNETDNDDGANWCATPTATYGAGDKGTPGAPNQACPPPPPNWTDDIYPLAQANCAPCHIGTGAPSGGFDQDFYTNWLASSGEVPTMKRINPGATATSYLWHKINGTQASVGGSGGQMPLGRPPLSAPNKDLIEDWILAGAPEN